MRGCENILKDILRENISVYVEGIKSESYFIGQYQANDVDGGCGVGN